MSECDNPASNEFSNTPIIKLVENSAKCETERPVSDEEEPDVDPIEDIIDYLVHCARGAFPCARVGESESRTIHNTQLARKIYQKSVSDFLACYGKHLSLNHLEYFESTTQPDEKNTVLRQIEQLRRYHSPEGKHKRVKNRRYKALQKLRDESDYFSEREMMFRNPLLYEQLVGQFLTDEEIAQRDEVDSDRLTFLNMILDTVDRNQMRQTRNEQELSEKMETTEISEAPSKPKPKTSKPTSHWGEFEGSEVSSNKSCTRWGDFEKPDPTPSFEPDVRKQTMISAPERELLRREFLHEMYGNFLEGRDVDFDYDTVDENEQYDDLQIVDRDKEEQYFDSEPNENDNLEQTLHLTHEYARKPPPSDGEDELDVFMNHLSKKQHSVVN